MFVIKALNTIVAIWTKLMISRFRYLTVFVTFSAMFILMAFVNGRTSWLTTFVALLTGAACAGLMYLYVKYPELRLNR